MADVFTLLMDGKSYRLRVKFPDLTRGFRIPAGKNAGEYLDNSYELDSKGTFLDYEMAVEPHPLYHQDYDAFFKDISDPEGIHIIQNMPYGQTTISLKVTVTSGSDHYRGKVGGVKRWSGLTVKFVAKEPSRR